MSSEYVTRDGDLLDLDSEEYRACLERFRSWLEAADEPDLLTDTLMALWTGSPLPDPLWLAERLEAGMANPRQRFDRAMGYSPANGRRPGFTHQRELALWWRTFRTTGPLDPPSPPSARTVQRWLDSEARCLMDLHLEGLDNT